MTTEVTEEEQAQMAVKLAENVRELIRKEMTEALQDYTFLNRTNLHQMFSAMLDQHSSSDSFKRAVKSVIRNSLDHSY